MVKVSGTVRIFLPYVLLAAYLLLVGEGHFPSPDVSVRKEFSAPPGQFSPPERTDLSSIPAQAPSGICSLSAPSISVLSARMARSSARVRISGSGIQMLAHCPSSCDSGRSHSVSGLSVKAYPVPGGHSFLLFDCCLRI